MGVFKPNWQNILTATGWTGVDMFTSLLPEVVPEIDTIPVSFYSGGGGRVVYREFTK